MEKLPDSADTLEVRVRLSDYRARVVWVGAGQVNAAVEEVCPPGEYTLQVNCGERITEGCRVRVVRGNGG